MYYADLDSLYFDDLQVSSNLQVNFGPASVAFEIRWDSSSFNATSKYFDGSRFYTNTMGASNCAGIKPTFPYPVQRIDFCSDRSCILLQLRYSTGTNVVHLQTKLNTTTGAYIPANNQYIQPCNLNNLLSNTFYSNGTYSLFKTGSGPRGFPVPTNNLYYGSGYTITAINFPLVMIPNTNLFVQQNGVLSWLNITDPAKPLIQDVINTGLSNYFLFIYISNI